MFQAPDAPWSINNRQSSCMWLVVGDWWLEADGWRLGLLSATNRQPRTTNHRLAWFGRPGQDRLSSGLHFVGPADGGRMRRLVQKVRVLLADLTQGLGKGVERFLALGFGRF